MIREVIWCLAENRAWKWTTSTVIGVIRTTLACINFWHAAEIMQWPLWSDTCTLVWGDCSCTVAKIFDSSNGWRPNTNTTSTAMLKLGTYPDHVCGCVCYVDLRPCAICSPLDTLFVAAVVVIRPFSLLTRPRGLMRTRASKTCYKAIVAKFQFECVVHILQYVLLGFCEGEVNVWLRRLQ